MKTGDHDIVLVTIGCSSHDEAKKISRILVDEKLAACANAYTVHSMYDWRGDRKEIPEVQLELKTLRTKIDDIEQRVQDLHSYEVPGILVVSVESVNESFADWVSKQVS